MIEINQTINVNGVVKIKDGEDMKQVAFLSASINVNGNLTSGRNIQDAEMFRLYKEEIEGDFAAFDNYVYDYAEETRKKWEEEKKKAEEPDAESAQ